MELFKQLLLLESKSASDKELLYTIQTINKCYNLWKVRKRRKNAVDLVVTTVNKLSIINPNVIPHLHDAARLKLVIMILRCIDGSNWGQVAAKAKVYTKLFGLIDKLQHLPTNSGTGGNLREAIMTRLSAMLTNEKSVNVFVAYEPKIPTAYLNYLFPENKPEKTYRMQSLPLPEDFTQLVSTLEINLSKAESKFNN